MRAGVPELNRLASSGSPRRATGQMLTRVPYVGLPPYSTITPGGGS